jgi:hypothetical protein
MPFPRPPVVSVRGKADRWKLFSWAFVVVEGRNEGQFLPAVAGRTKAVMAVTKVVVVVGCFAVFYCPVSPEISMKHTRSSIGLQWC